MKVLVTGGAGFIGSQFVKTVLALTDWRVRILDALTYAGNLDNFSRELRDRRVEFVHGNICDSRKVRQSLRGCDVVVNFAAETHIDRSIMDAAPFLRSDFAGAVTLLDEFKRAPGQLFVQVSTSEVYGSASTATMDEAHPLEPQSPYAAAKLGGDRAAMAYHRTHGLPVTVLRPFNAYGHNQYPEKVIPFFITQSLQGQPLYIYGDGGSLRDWTHVDDLCRAVLAVAQSDPLKVSGEVFNIGTGETASVAKIAKIVTEMIGGEVRHIQPRPGEVARLTCDHSKLTRLTGWTPRIYFASGLPQTVGWYTANRDWWTRIVRRREFRDYCRDWHTRVLGAA